MTDDAETLALAPLPGRPLDLGGVAPLLLAVALFELVGGRLVGALGLFVDPALAARLAPLIPLGRFALVATSLAAFVLVAVALPRVATDAAVCGRAARVLLLVGSLFYLPALGVAVLRPSSGWPVFVAFLAIVATLVVLAVQIATRRWPLARRRLFVSLAAVELLGAVELTSRLFLGNEGQSLRALIPRQAYLLSEILFVLAPLAGLVALATRGPLAALRRPHPLALALAVLGAGAFLAFATFGASPAYLLLVLYRVGGLTLSLPGGFWGYGLALGVVIYLVASLLLPGAGLPRTDARRRAGFGLAAIFIAGLQPTQPYQMLLALAGFLLLVEGLAPADAPAK